MSAALDWLCLALGAIAGGMFLGSAMGWPGVIVGVLLGAAFAWVDSPDRKTP